MNEQRFCYPKADFGKRLIALLIDLLILLLSIPLFVFTGMILEDLWSLGDWWVLGLVFPIIFLFHFFLKDSISNGQSYGKRYMGLIVIDCETNKTCNKKQSAIRQLIFLVFSLIECVITLLQGEGRRLGDFVAKTQVIDFAEYKKQKNAQIQ